MREIRKSGSEGGARQTNVSFPPLSTKRNPARQVPMKRKRRRSVDLRLCFERSVLRELLLVENGIPLVDAFSLGCEERVCGIKDFDLLNCVAHADRVDHILALRGDTKDRVASVEVRSGHMGDEKLAAVCSWARIRHGEDAGLVVHETGFDLVLEAVARTSTASAGWVAALDHKLGNHAMEGCHCSSRALGEVQEIRHGYRCCRRFKSGLNRAFVGVNDDADVLHGASVCRRVGGDCQTEKQG